MTSLLQQLSELFGAVSRVLADPEVQKAGDNFLTAWNKAVDRELPETETVHELGKGLTGYDC